jgi:23S rRNA pseudouridine1911/1915/1917 synthase
MEPKKIYEDEHILAMYKPRGLLTVAAKKKDPNLLYYAKEKFADGEMRIRALHRLDRDSSGVVLFAKTKECYEAAIDKKRFSDVRKVYLALVLGVLKQKHGTITIPLPSRKNKNLKLAAKTSYRVLKVYPLPNREKASLVEVEIFHGRKHQIRKHFSMVGHPLLMDRDYMDRKTYKYFQQLIGLRHFFLHAKKVSFPHFVKGGLVEINTGMPQELDEVEAKL